MFEVLCIGSLLLGVTVLLAGYVKTTSDVLKDIGIINPLTVTLAILAIIGIIAELLKVR